MMTETEASGKRCPLAFPAAGGINPGGFNYPVSGAFVSSAGFVVNHAPLNCIGSACMAWQVMTPEQPARSARITQSSFDGSTTHIPEQEAKPAIGFCGMLRRLGSL